MNIKGFKKSDSKSLSLEDKQMRKIASKKGDNGITIVLAIILVLLFLSTLYITLVYIDKYYGVTVEENQEIIKVHTGKGTATIINNGVISEEVNSEYFQNEDKVTIENIDILKLEVEDEDSEITISYNVNYVISQNDFPVSYASSKSSSVLVKFSYSLDNENWTYVNNALSTYNSNIMPLVGNNYDISGLVTTISVATNYELTASSLDSTTIYWRSETIFQNTVEIEEDIVFNANFSINYTSSK